MVVASLLASASAATGALAGWVGGVAWSALLGPSLNVWALAALVGGCLVLDLVGVPPFSVLRQVPQLWGRIFSSRVVAVLYGARLGVGPLTILRTWLWWGSFVAASSAGPWWGAGVGAAFGLCRITAMLASGTRAGALQPRERRVSALLAAAVLVALALVAAAVGDEDEVAGGGAVAARDAARRAPADGDENPAPANVVDDDAEDAGDDDAEATTTSVDVAASDLSTVLAARLPESLLPGWTRTPDGRSRRLGPLDLAAAAAAEADTPAERALLETRHFRRGHARGWRGPEGQVGYASVYEFATPADAAAYLVDGVTTIESRGARVYDVATPEGGRGFSQAEQGAAGEGSTVSHGVVFVEGARFFLVFLSGKDSSVDPTLAAEAARSVAGA